MEFTGDGILGLLGGIIGVFGAWYIASWQNQQPVRNIITVYKFFLEKELEKILLKSFKTDANENLISKDLPLMYIEDVAKESQNIISKYIPLLKKRKLHIINSINTEFENLIDTVHTIWFEKLPNPGKNNTFEIRNDPNSIKKVEEIKKLLQKL